MVNRECDVLALIIHDKLSNVSFYEPEASNTIKLLLRRTLVLRKSYELLAVSL
jgi:hypothetical protein